MIRAMGTSVEQTTREGLLRRGLRLEYFTIVWNVLEAVVGLTAGLLAGSVALVGFALDSLVETSSGGILVWRLRSERGGRGSEELERRAVRGVALAFFALAAYVGVQAVVDLVRAAHPDPSVPGIGLAAVSLVVMPVLAWRKRVTARALDSRSLQADSTQTLLCVLLSGALLVGLVANAALGWWWADPAAGLFIAVVAAREGRELWTTEDVCCA